MMHALGHSTSRNESLPSWKRGLDILCCLAALPFMAVAALWASLITMVASPGPILFRQERVGLRGRKFYLYKFRTMHVSANTASHRAHFVRLMKANTPMQKLDQQGDRRLIPGGWLLRATGLDELPQIINVLRGEMSIVGPRPCIPYEYECYTDEQRRRLESMPGLTGLWQVSGKNRTTFDEMIRLDVSYATQRSLGLDISIIFRTPGALIAQVLDTRRARRTAAAAPAAEVTAGAEVAVESFSATYAGKSQNVIVDTVEPRPVYMSRRVSDPYVTSTNLQAQALSGKRRADPTGSIS
jgi:lipopolysaccharide/colanic/teichoic acid biosynthesis glycosyltransferase